MGSYAIAGLRGPLLAMFSLTFFVWLWMYIHRFRWIVMNRIDPQRFAYIPTNVASLPDNVRRPPANLANLFELPVIFYALVAYLMINDSAVRMDVLLAYGFVAGRWIHSLIHCLWNRVPWRFAAYFASSICLWWMVARAILSG